MANTIELSVIKLEKSSDNGTKRMIQDEMKIPEILTRLIDGNHRLSILTDRAGTIRYFGKPMYKLFPTIEIGRQFTDFFDYSADEPGFYHHIKSLYKLFDKSQRTYKVSADSPTDDLVLIQLSPLFKPSESLNDWSLTLEDIPEHSLIMENIFLREIMEMGRSEVLMSQDKTNQIEKLSRENSKYLNQLTSILRSNNLLALEYDALKKHFHFTSESAAQDFFKTELISDQLDQFAEELLIPSQQKSFISIFESINPNKSEVEEDLLMRTDQNHFEWIGLRVKASKFVDNKCVTAFVVFEKKQFQKEMELVEANAQEEERFRVSREIHDGIGQTLVALRLLLSNARKKNDILDVQEIQKEMDQYLNDVIKETRIIINNLGVSVFQNDGLKGAFLKQIELLSKVSQVEVNLDWKGPEKLANPKLAINFFRIFQESVSNVIRHSGATEMRISVINNELFVMQITDNGRGFDVNETATGFGLNNMQGRANAIKARFKISSKLGKGTTIFLKSK